MGIDKLISNAYNIGISGKCRESRIDNLNEHKEGVSHGESYRSEPHFLSWQGRD